MKWQHNWLEQEKKQLVSMLDEAYKEKFLESKLEEDRGNFEKEMQKNDV